VCDAMDDASGYSPVAAQDCLRGPGGKAFSECVRVWEAGRVWACVHARACALGFPWCMDCFAGVVVVVQGLRGGGVGAIGARTDVHAPPPTVTLPCGRRVCHTVFGSWTVGCGTGDGDGCAGC
jgi:hypothetical protein